MNQLNKKITDFEAYRENLESLLGKSREIMRVVINKAKKDKEDKAKKLAQVITNDSCRKILDYLADQEATESVFSILV